MDIKSSAATAVEQPNPSLFDRLGGVAAVDAAVDLFYRKVLADPTVNRFFDLTDMEGQRAKQRAFLTMAFGGPSNYTGKDLRAAHAPLVAKGLNETHFDCGDDDVIAAIEMGRVHGLVLTAQPDRHNGRKATQNDTLGINDEPFFLDLGDLGGIGGHGGFLA